MLDEGIIEVAFELGLDVYIWDHRGTGRSTWLGCPETVNKEAHKITAENAAACAEEAKTRSGLCDLKHFSQTSAAHDLMALIKQTVAQDGSDADRVYIYGVSYGTAVAQRFLQIGGGPLVKGIILDGIVAQESIRIDTYMTAAIYSVQMLMTFCEESPDCARAFGIPDVDDANPKAPGVRGWEALTKVTEKILLIDNMCTNVLFNKGLLPQGPDIKNNKAGRRKASREEIEDLIITSLQLGEKNLLGQPDSDLDFRVGMLAFLAHWARCDTKQGPTFDPPFLEAFLRTMKKLDKMMNAKNEEGQDPDAYDESEVAYVNIAYSELYWISELERKTNKASPTYYANRAGEIFHEKTTSILGSLTSQQKNLEQQPEMSPDTVRAWPSYTPKAELVDRTPTKSSLDTEVMIFNGYLDAATPHWAAEDVMFKMQAGPIDTSKKLVTLPKMGHSILLDNECAQSLLKTMVTKGIEAVDDTCARSEVVNFQGITPGPNQGKYLGMMFGASAKQGIWFGF